MTPPTPSPGGVRATARQWHGRIYDGAKLGLRGDSLALAAGLLPVELARLKLMDPIAEIAEMKGRADSEMTMSRTLYEAAEGGDAKAALEFLRHRHDWQAAQRIQVDVAQSISYHCRSGDGREACACSGSDRGCGGNP
jgi:hypothetical protein